MHRTTRWIPRLALAAGFLAIAARADAQLIIDLRVGATLTSNLVSDVIVDPVQVRPAVAPTVGAAVGTRLNPLYSVHLRGEWSRSNLQQHQAETSTTVLTLTMWQAAVALERHMTARVTAHGLIGVLKYAPAAEGRDASLFRGDAPALPVAGIGASIVQPLTSEYAATLMATWAVHRFTTAPLRAAGFDGRRTVHRVFIGATIRRENNRETR